AQRDNYLPLRVIKQQLDALDNGLEPGDAGAGTAKPHVLAAPGDDNKTDSKDVRLTRESLLEAAAITEDQLAELESFGLIDGRSSRFDADDLVIARTAGELAEYGLEPRHLR